MDQVGTELVDAVAHLRAHRMERVEISERRRGFHLRGDVPVLEPVYLVERDHDRNSEREHAPCDEPVARTDPIPRGEDEEHDVDVLERAVDRLLHALREGVHRALEAGEVDEHELPVLAVGDAEDPSAGRVRDGRGDRHLLARERVDERRLPHVRTASDSDQASLHVGSVAVACHRVRWSWHTRHDRRVAAIPIDAPPARDRTIHRPRPDPFRTVTPRPGRSRPATRLPGQADA
jgi:hypothetical protein